jgi:hypothetical protein
MSKSLEQQIISKIWPNGRVGDRWVSRVDQIRYGRLSAGDMYESCSQLADGWAHYTHYFDGLRDIVSVTYGRDGFVVLVHNGYQSVVVYWQAPRGNVRIDRRNEFFVAA